jgi:pimeloyl-ACP methyl ester carboxylesterase
MKRPAAAPRDLVVLLHGLGRTRLSLWRLERALREAGYETLNWGYPSRRLDFAQLARRFRALLARLAGRPGRVHFVGHSLGALLIRAGLSEPAGFRVGRIVMLAPPNRGAAIVNEIARVPGLPRLFGRITAELRRDSEALRGLGVPRAEIGIVAGTRELHLLNPSSWLMALIGAREAHDGTVELESQPLPGMRDFVAVETTHTIIADHPETIRQTLHFLAKGVFDHRPAGPPT